MVTVCETGWPDDEQAAAALRADLAALNIHPPERTWTVSEPAERAAEFVEPGSAGRTPGGRPPFDVSTGDAGTGGPGTGGRGDDGPGVEGPGYDGRGEGRPGDADRPGGDGPGGGNGPRGDRPEAAGNPRAVSGAGTAASRVAAHLAARTGTVTFGDRDEGDGQDTLTLRDVTGRGLDPLTVRLAFLGRRYRDPLSLTWDVLADADAILRRWRQRVADWAQSPSAPMSRQYAEAVVAAFDDDLDSPAALRAMRELEADGSVPAGAKFETFAAMDRLLGLDLAADLGKAPAPAT
jgi:cysteinyl-tRNA synthetase